MRLGMVIYGSLDQQTGGYLYDRKVLEYLRTQGDHIEIISLPWRNYRQHLMDNLSHCLYRTLSELEVDLLIEDELNHPSLVYLNWLLRRNKRFPLISIVHHMRCNEVSGVGQRWFARTVEKIFLSSLDGLICNSQTTLRSIHAILPPKNQLHLPYVIAYPGKDHLKGEITEAEIDQRAKDGERLRLLFLGNVIPRKGLHWLIAALSTLRQFPLQLDIVGDESRHSAYARQIHQSVERAGLRDRIRFWGSVSQGTLGRILRQAQVLVMPSRYEGFGIAYLDGMRYGLAILASAQGGARELITDGREGYLIAPGDVLTLAERVQELHNDRSRLAQMGIAARKRFEAHPTWAESAAKIRQFLQSLIG